jgi:O-antigen ligase
MFLWLLVGYMWLYVHRPFEIWPVLATFRLELVYILFVLAGWLVYSGKEFTASKIHLAFASFSVAVLICWMASPWISEASVVPINFFKVTVFYLLLVTTIRDEKQLRFIIAAFLAVMTLYMTHSLREYRNGRIEYRMDTPRMIGVDSSMGDPNSFAATVLYALPLVIPFWMTTASTRWRLALAAYVAISAICIVLTGSRSGFLGMLLLGAIVVFRSRWRWKLLAASVLLAPLLWYAVPGELQGRFMTIVNPEAGPANAQTSADSRIEGLRIGFALLRSSPLTGCGPGAWIPATGRGIESHNLYGQVMGEMGLLGCVTFAVLLAALFAEIVQIRRAYSVYPGRNCDFLYWLASAIGLAFVLMLVEGNFGHNLYRYNWLWYGAFLVVAKRCLAERAEYTFDQGWVQAEFPPAATDPGTAIIPACMPRTHAQATSENHNDGF